MRKRILNGLAYTLGLVLIVLTVSSCSNRSISGMQRSNEITIAKAEPVSESIEVAVEEKSTPETVTTEPVNSAYVTETHRLNNEASIAAERSVRTETKELNVRKFKKAAKALALAPVLGKKKAIASETEINQGFLEGNLRLAIIFAVVGLILYLIGGLLPLIGIVFFVFGTIFIVVALVLLLVWLLDNV